MIRGAVYKVSLGDAKRGSEQRGNRLGLVLSRTDWTMVTVVPTSTSAQDSVFRPRMEIAGRSTLLLVDQIRSLDIQYLVGDPVDYLDRLDMGQLENAVRAYLGL
ncbi:type II toxin-antitoxin system toxin endoribonuclease PemK [Actinocorallia lasiicapitis]